MSVASLAFLAFVVLAAVAVVETRSSPDFERREVVRPEFYHKRTKRYVTTTHHQRSSSSAHINDLALSFDSRGQKFILDLKLNTNLIPKEYFHKYQAKVGRHFLKVVHLFGW